MADLPIITIKAGREKKIRSAYPWVQREEVVRSEHCPAGSVAELRAASGEFLAIGTLNDKSRFPFRVLTLEQETIDTSWFVSRFERCKKRRETIQGTNGVREIFSEADGVPGLIVDRYDRTLVVQVRSAGMEHLKSHWLPALQSAYDPVAIFERSEMEGRKEEGLDSFAGLLFGTLPEPVTMQEDELVFEVPVQEGLKTGYYLDQRDTRRRLAARVQPSETVLDAFCYSGGFSLHAARAGAKTTGIDISEVAISTAQANAKCNELEKQCDFIHVNAFDYLAEEPKGALYDWIVLDPPAIAKQHDKKSSLKWGIWKLVYNSVDHLKEGGRMVVCSCSYQLGLSEMLDTIRLAASDRGKLVFLEEITFQSPDHPHLLQFPESLYLKCAWVRIESA